MGSCSYEPHKKLEAGASRLTTYYLIFTTYHLLRLFQNLTP